ncbi:MAG: UvrD-helicase domain-containing protein [Candidatus Firestonebacteria bacterium]
MEKNILLNGLNDKQIEAVVHFNGPLLILAGAGTGKTRVITHRIAYLINEYKISPHNILAVTFTNKAADEMKNRMLKLAGKDGHSVWMSTFHSFCARVLRREGTKIGLPPGYIVYDDDDQQKVIKKCIEELKFSADKLQPGVIQNRISSAKNELMSPSEYDGMCYDVSSKIIAKIYELYQAKLQKYGACDFDDLIMKTVLLFRKYPEVLDIYQDKYKYIMVDEYQDVNHSQYVLTKLLAKKDKNICVVGDPDQSIYRWRGADIRNILNFEKDFPQAKIVLLEENYRSTDVILEAASCVIKNNCQRKEKILWTQKNGGTKILCVCLWDETEESRFIASKISEFKSNGLNYKNMVLLYRTNAQSRSLEDGLRRSGIPYAIVGGLRFYERKEIKDIIAYLRILFNPADDISLRRIINVPSRGIGETTIKKIEEEVKIKGASLYDVVMSKNEKAIANFTKLINQLKNDIEGVILPDAIKFIIDRTNYIKMLEEVYIDDADDRIENLRELVSGAAEFIENNYKGKTDILETVTAFLEQITLITNVDRWKPDSDAITMMTMHNAKGLEFDTVFLTGLEEGLFPHNASMDEINELEEERRLCYVGLTRAKSSLYLTYAKERMRYGSRFTSMPSRFIKEIPKHLIEHYGNEEYRSHAKYDDDYNDSDDLEGETSHSN